MLMGRRGFILVFEQLQEQSALTVSSNKTKYPPIPLSVVAENQLIRPRAREDEGLVGWRPRGTRGDSPSELRGCAGAHALPGQSQASGPIPPSRSRVSTVTGFPLLLAPLTPQIQAPGFLADAFELRSSKTGGRTLKSGLLFLVHHKLEIEPGQCVLNLR